MVEARIAARGSGLGLGPLIPPGMRAMAVRVNDVVGVAGFVLPGMRVDVLVTGRPPGRAEAYTRTVLQNITVLSAGQTIDTDGKGQAINTPVVTLLVSPADAETLTLSNSEGHIQLVLRNSSDQQVAGTRGRQTLELYGAPAPAEPAAEPAPKPRARRAGGRVETGGSDAAGPRSPAAAPAGAGDDDPREREDHRGAAQARRVEMKRMDAGLRCSPEPPRRSTPRGRRSPYLLRWAAAR